MTEKEKRLQKCVNYIIKANADGWLISLNCNRCSVEQRKFCGVNYPKFREKTLADNKSKGEKDGN
jgi:hypothetical protein